MKSLHCITYAILIFLGVAMLGCMDEPAPITVTSVTLDSTSLSLIEGESQKLTATVSPSNAENKEVLWTSSNSTVASVKDGLVTALKPGIATITVKTDDGGKTATCEVTVTAKDYPVESVSLDKTSYEITEGDEFTLTATVKPDNATNKNVIWSSSNPSVASVVNGKVTALKTGKSTITVKTENGDKTASCDVSVNVLVYPVESVSLDKTSYEMTEGDEFTLTATVKPDNATNKNVIWSSSNPSVASVVNGKVTALKTGKSTITVKTENGDKTASCDVTVNVLVYPVESVSLDKTSYEMIEGDEFTLTATVKPDNATNKNVTWSSSNTEIVTVSNGKVTAINSGRATITVTTEDGEKTAECSITVKSTPAIITLDRVTAATATFMGHIDVSESELPFTKVTVYYSDAEIFNINATKSASATSFDRDQNFTITLTNLKYGTKYNYCMVTEVKSVKTYGEVLSLTTSNVTLDNVAVTPNSFDAMISGVVSGLSEEDKNYIKVGVVYSTERSSVESAYGTKVNAYEIISEGSFDVALSNLSLETKYYYGAYILHNGNYSLGEISEFTTLKHPYCITQDLDLSSATDLSSSSSANCYIVSEDGLYKFRTVKGNSDESIGHIASASILWETFGTSETPQYLDLIKAFCYQDGYIVFHTADTFKEGNAVIAAKDAEGNIIWSWHIWLSDEPQEQIYKNNAGTMMDRNLGATSATPGDIGALGLFYQWGRKDPFIGASSLTRNIYAKSTIEWPAVGTTSSLDYSTANPTVFIEEYNYNERVSTWESEKTIHDPCPVGWRVPDGGSNGIWSKAQITASYDSANNGNHVEILSPSTAWYPSTGERAINGNLGGVTGSTSYYSCTPTSYSINSVHTLWFKNNSTGYIITSSSLGCAYGLPVRCCKE